MSWVLAIAGFAALVVLHEAGHFTAAKAVGMRVERFFLFFPPKVISITRGETEYGIGAIPLGGFVKITGMNPEEEIPPEVEHRAYYKQPVWKRIVVIAAGPLVNIVLALVLFFILAVGFGLDDPDEPTNTIRGVDSSLAAADSLESGDVLVSIDGNQVDGLTGMTLIDTVRSQVATHECAGPETDGCEATTPVVLEILREGEAQTIEVTPTFSAPEPLPGEEPVEPRMLVGFDYEYERETVSAGEGAEFAVDRLWLITSRTAEVFAGIFEAEQREQITGIVGATEVTRQSIEFDTRQAIGVLAVISLSLGLVNLLPFLPLDGGHIFWALVEKIKGSPVPLSIMERSGFIGFALVLVLFFIGLQNDIGRLTGDGFNVR